MSFKDIIWCVALLAFSPVCKAQENEENLEEQLLEQLGEELGEEVDISEIMEKLNFMRRNPIDLNRATEAELSALVFLKPDQVTNIIAHRELSGDFLSLLELQAIPGMDLQTIQRLTPFVHIGGKSSLAGVTWKSLKEENEQTIMLRLSRVLQKARGYGITDESRSRYLGDRNSYALRYRWNYQGKIRIGFNAEKDAGEPFFALQQKGGFDFYSAYVEVNGVHSRISKIILGDYILQIGQGLILWNGLNFGKGTLASTVSRQGAGLLAYSSMNENNFQRGIAATVRHRKWTMTPFVAFNRLSGNVTHSDFGKLINTISTSGLHRTPTEQSYRHQIAQFVAGTDISFSYRKLKIGFTSLYTRFDGKVMKGDELRNKFNFEGQDLLQIGFHYKYSYRNLYFFGETAHSLGSGLAMVNGVLGSLHPRLSVFVHQRHFQKDYHSFFAQTLSEGSNIANEKGVYAGFKYEVARRWEWINYVDMFAFPWLRYRVDGPSEGVDILSQFTYHWYKRGSFQLRYRYRVRQENLLMSERHENVLADVVRNQLRGDFQYKLNKIWSIRTRGEVSLYEKKGDSKSRGYLLFQDVSWNMQKIQLNTRLSYFNTEDYESRIYTYERDVLYASSYPIFYDRGWRTYVNVRYRLSRNIDVWMKYSLTQYTDRETIGSGLDQIDGRRKSEIRFQVRWQW